MSTENPKAETKEVTIHFINVGHGDCILISSPDGASDGYHILIDCFDRFLRVRAQGVLASSS